MKDRVTIMGFGTTARVVECDHDDVLDSDIWTLNQFYQHFTGQILDNLNAVFCMHTFSFEENLPADKVTGKPHIQLLDEYGEKGVPIFMEDRHPLVTNSKRFPLEKLQKMVHGTAPEAKKFFTGTIAYMVAYAIYLGYKEILTFGIDQLDPDHAAQRPCFAFWMGFAAGRGIKLRGVQQFWGHQKLYGYDPDSWSASQAEQWRGFPFAIVIKDYNLPTRTDEIRLPKRYIKWAKEHQKKEKKDAPQET